MNETKWVCERCGKEYDLEKGEGRVILVEEGPLPQDGKLTSLVPYERVCYECADELYAIMEKCNKDCLNCEVTTIWGLSIKDCLEFQLKFDLIDYQSALSLEAVNLDNIKGLRLRILNSLEDTKGLLRTLNRL